MTSTDKPETFIPETSATVSEAVTVQAGVPPLPLENVNLNPLKKDLTLQEFVETFQPLDKGNAVVKSLAWEKVTQISLGIIGAEKLKAKAAAAHQLCWTLCRHGEKLRIEAGCNCDEPEKLGYIITLKAWADLDQTVVQ